LPGWLSQQVEKLQHLDEFVGSASSNVWLAVCQQQRVAFHIMTGFADCRKPA
jgi:hypothetical protein